MSIEFKLPEHAIAQYPCEQRTHARMLHLKRHHTHHTDQHVYDLPQHLRPGDCLVINNTQVVPAQFNGRKTTGGKIHCQLDRCISTHQAILFIKSSHAPAPQDTLIFDEQITATVLSKEHTRFTVQFNQPVQTVLNTIGQPPIPPYLKRPAEPIDRMRYQTCFAQHPGAVAAPTAGLHFDDALLNTLKQQDITVAELTLHVGAGTFEPINETHLSSGKLHAEHFEITHALSKTWDTTRRNGGRIIAVGTTCVRALESAYHEGQLLPQSSETQCFIRPGYTFQAIDGLLTNFHLPGSSLLYLVEAFTGRKSLETAYTHAIQHQYRFYSYGDCMLIL